MFAKPFTFLLVFLLAITNFIVLLVPVSVLFFPLFMLFQSLFIQIGPNIFFFLVSRISGAIIIYMLLDTLFGFTVRRMRKGCIPFKKATIVHGHQDILDSFEWLKRKFKIKNVNLYVSPDFNVVNAYAVGSFSGSSVTITMGLLHKIQEESKSNDEYLDAVNAILGHEMSHLANKDFLPGLLTSASESATNRISKIIRFVFISLATILRIIPWVGWTISKLVISIYNVINFVIMAFFKFIFTPIYNFMINFFGRSIEYRCDRESAYAYGGHKMAKALSMLGKNGYFSLFSTHPTTSSRIKSVKNIVPESGTIRPAIINIFSDGISVLLVVFICVYSTSLSNSPDIYRHYINEVYNPIKYKTNEYLGDFSQYYNKYKPVLEQFYKGN